MCLPDVYLSVLAVGSEFVYAPVCVRVCVVFAAHCVSTCSRASKRLDRRRRRGTRYCQCLLPALSASA